ncbi:MAG: LTA synthase family protein [Bacilli bacterium]
MSFNTVSQAGAVKEYIKDFLMSMKGIYLCIFIPFAFCLICFILKNVKNKNFSKDFKLKKTYTYEYQIITIIMLILIVIFSYSYYYTLDDKYNTDKLQVTKLKDLFVSASNPSLCVKDFGIISYGLIDVKAKVLGSTDSELIFAYNQEKKQEDNSRDIDDTVWNDIIANETNTTLNTLNNYFISQNITNKNEYTGMFENKNLIVIMMESVNDIIINSKYYPNFDYLLNHSYYFENNYSPRNSCATGNNEFSTLTSLYSIYNNCTANIYQDNTYFESMFNLFNNSGYTTNSFHNYNNTYYYRTVIHPNMGSMNYYDANSLNIDYSTIYGKWASDEDLMQKYLEKLDSENPEKFMSYIITVSSHQPYSISSPYGDMYLDLFTDEDYSMDIKRYMSKLKVLDNALGILIEGLKERNLLEDTVIVLFGDHYPYGITLDHLNEVLERDLNDYENEKVPLLIFNSNLEKTTFSTYTSYINLLPTIANLFNLDYDPRLYQGEDVFSSDYTNLVVFYDMSWKNDLAYYNAVTGKITYYTDFTYTEEEIKKINEMVYNKINTSSLAIKNNYFAYLKEKIDERKEN